MTDRPDIVARLRAYTQHNRPVLPSDLKEAADYIEQLKSELVAALAHRDIARDDLAARKRAGVPAADSRFEEIERRLALLESSARLNSHRLAMAAHSMAECRLESPTAGRVAARLREALHSTEETSDPPGWWAWRSDDGVSYGLIIDGVKSPRVGVAFGDAGESNTWAEARRHMWQLYRDGGRGHV